MRCVAAPPLSVKGVGYCWFVIVASPGTCCYILVGICTTLICEFSRSSLVVVCLVALLEFFASPASPAYSEDVDFWGLAMSLAACLSTGRADLRSWGALECTASAAGVEGLKTTVSTEVADAYPGTVIRMLHRPAHIGNYVPSRNYVARNSKVYVARYSKVFVGPLVRSELLRAWLVQQRLSEGMVAVANGVNGYASVENLIEKSSNVFLIL